MVERQTDRPMASLYKRTDICHLVLTFSVTVFKRSSAICPHLPLFIIFLGWVPAVQVSAQTFTLLHAIQEWEADGPYGKPVLSDGTLYGTTQNGSSNNYGVVFAVNTNGTSFRILHSFSFNDGIEPLGQLVSGGNTLYGTTSLGGGGWGTVFSINTNGSNFRVLHSFSWLGPYARSNTRLQIRFLQRSSSSG
jgi:uncharacterized repeat protein (TIGR03803 family)